MLSQIYKPCESKTKIICLGFLLQVQSARTVLPAVLALFLAFSSCIALFVPFALRAVVGHRSLGASYAICAPATSGRTNFDVFHFFHNEEIRHVSVFF